jgi:haloacid dehalogenase-like hydrolase
MAGSQSPTYDARARLIRFRESAPESLQRRAGRRIVALACDLDRTLLRPRGGPTAAGRTALREAREMGLLTLLVSGREYSELVSYARRFGALDALVAENGAVVEAPIGASPTIVGRSVAETIRRRLRAIPGLRPRFGEVVASVPIRERSRMAASLRGVPVRVIANVDRVMAVPVGVDKRRGTRIAMERLDLGRRAYAAIGDAENDLELLRSATLSGAVRNAEAIVRGSVDYVCRSPYAEGALEFVRGPLVARLRDDQRPPGASDGSRGSGRAPR